MYVKEQISQAKKEAGEGKKNKAAQRLRNVINTYPDAMEVREALAMLYYEAGFLDLAGLYWLLTEPTSAIQRCVDAYMQTINYSAVQALKDFKYRGDATTLPVYARKRLDYLDAEKQKVQSDIRPVKKVPQPPKEDNAVMKWLRPKLAWGCFIMVILIFLTGLGTVLEFIKMLF